MTVRSRWAIVRIVLSANSLQQEGQRLVRNSEKDDILSNRFSDELVGGIVNTGHIMLDLTPFMSSSAIPRRRLGKAISVL